MARSANNPLPVRKTRPATGLRAAIQQLSPERQAAFHAMMEEDTSYRKMVSRAKADFGIQCSTAGLAGYRQWRFKQAIFDAPGQTREIRVGGFELLISIPRTGVMRVVARELAPAEGEQGETSA